MPNWKKVIISGSDAALNSLEITSHLTASGLIYPTADGTDGQAITTDAAGNLTFGNPGFADEAEKVTFEVQNGDTGTLAKGTPVHITSMTGGTAIVVAASASVASKMPSHGILNQQLTAGSDGFATILGQVTGVNTSAFSPGDTVYVGPSGGYTNVKPSGSTNLIQNLGVVKKVDASNGTGEIFGSGRTNDVPNLPTGKIWVGDGYTVTSSVVHLDESNERLGINTNTPNQALDVLGSANISGSLIIDNPSYSGTHTIAQIANNQFRFTNSGIGAYMTVGSGNAVEINSQRLKSLGRGLELDATISSTPLQVGTAGVGTGKGLTVLNSASNYNVGIGSNAPTAKLNIVGNGTTSATTALLIEDSSGTDLLEVNDQGNVTIPNGSLSLNGATDTETFNLAGNIFFDGNGTVSAGGVGNNLTLQAQSANIAIGYPGAADITITGGVSGSFSGSFEGDGTNLTGITAEWDGSHNGDAEITGSLVISGSSVELGVSGAAYFFHPDQTEHLRIKGSVIGGSRNNQTSYANSINLGTNSIDIKARSNINLYYNGNVRLTTSETYINLTENTSIGAGSSPSARLHVKGSGATSATDALLVENSSGTDLLKVYDDGITAFGDYTRGTGVQSDDYITTAGRVRAGGGITFRPPTVNDNTWYGFDYSSNFLNVRVGGATAKFGSSGANTNDSFYVSTGFNPSSGTTDKSFVRIESNNQSGAGYSGDVYALKIDHSLGSKSGTGNDYGVYQSNSSAYNYFNGSVGIGTTSPSAKLDVDGNAVISGSLELYNGALLVSGSNDSTLIGTDGEIELGYEAQPVRLNRNKYVLVNSGPDMVATVDSNLYLSAHFDYVIVKGTNLRAGTVMACHDGSSNVVFTEIATSDLGSTAGVTLNVVETGGNLELQMTVPSTGWFIKTFVRAI